ncbi:MAG TPA: hypothetical protein VMH23_06515 [Bacteroidota bacterium]|nr:hypothetical protein [Bacteroidota bacterium]
MPDARRSSKSVQWKWLGISFVIYFAFYLIPIIGARSVIGGRTAVIAIGIWALAGVVILAVIISFFSKGASLWELPIASAAIILGFTLSFYTFHSWSQTRPWSMFVDVGTSTVVTFLLSLCGMWIGTKLRRLKRHDHPQPSS